MFGIVSSYRCMQFQGRLMNQTWENVKKPSFGPDFDPFGPNSGRNILFKNQVPSVTRYHRQLSSCTLLEKIKDPVLKKLSGQTDRLTDESDFMGRCPINVKRPKCENEDLMKFSFQCKAYVPMRSNVKTNEACVCSAFGRFFLMCQPTKTIFWF